MKIMGTPRTAKAAFRLNLGDTYVVDTDFARQLEAELAEARAEIDKFNALLKNGIECFMTPCEKHSGENTPPFAEFMEKYGLKCTPCFAEELAAAKAELKKLKAKMRKQKVTK